MNYESHNMKLFPVKSNKLTEEEIMKICAKVIENAVLWGPCLYNWNKDDNSLELLYVSKRQSSYLETEEILNNFHVWEIQANEGNFCDIIICNSMFYNSAIQQTKVSSKLNESWHYSEKCQYQANKLRVVSTNKNIEVILGKYNGFNLSNEQNTYIKDLEITYRSCNDRMGIDELSDKTELVNFNFQDVLFKDGRIHEVVSGEFIGRIWEDNNLGTLFNSLEGDKMVKSIELLFNDRVVHRIDWKGIFRNSTADFWDNCKDVKYIEFRNWYIEGQKEAADNIV